MPAVGPREPFSFPLLEAKGRELGGFDARDQRGLLGRAQKIGGAREAGKLRRAEQVDLRGLGRSGEGGFRHRDASRSMREAIAFQRSIPAASPASASAPMRSATKTGARAPCWRSMASAPDRKSTRLNPSH